jgi:hypothetical protein
MVCRRVAPTGTPGCWWTHDRACDRLATLMGDTRAGMITVGAAAVQCVAILDGEPGWRAGAATAMICRNL